MGADTLNVSTDSLEVGAHTLKASTDGVKEGAHTLNTSSNHNNLVDFFYCQLGGAHT